MEKVDSKTVYATRTYKKPASMTDWSGMMVTGKPPNSRGAIILSVEDDKIQVRPLLA